MGVFNGTGSRPVTRWALIVALLVALGLVALAMRARSQGTPEDRRADALARLVDLGPDAVVLKHQDASQGVAHVYVSVEEGSDLRGLRVPQGFVREDLASETRTLWVASLDADPRFQRCTILARPYEGEIGQLYADAARSEIYMVGFAC